MRKRGRERERAREHERSRARANTPTERMPPNPLGPSRSLHYPRCSDRRVVVVLVAASFQEMDAVIQARKEAGEDEEDDDTLDTHCREFECKDPCQHFACSVM